MVLFLQILCVFYGFGAFCAEDTDACTLAANGGRVSSSTEQAQSSLDCPPSEDVSPSEHAFLKLTSELIMSLVMEKENCIGKFGNDNMDCLERAFLVLSRNENFRILPENQVIAILSEAGYTVSEGEVRLLRDAMD